MMYRLSGVVLLVLALGCDAPAGTAVSSGATPSSGTTASEPRSVSTERSATSADRPPRPAHSLFDPARHMLVSEVRPGMTGYGLTVFRGTRIERFDVQVISVLKNFNPKTDVVLIKCLGDYLKHTGSIAGMSGSPIFLRDDLGRDRMIGAFAYGWPMTRDPLAGVQPIQYMLELPTAGPQTRPAAGDGGVADVQTRQDLSWSLVKAGYLPLWRPWGKRSDEGAVGLSAADRTQIYGDAPQLRPLVTPLMCSGLSPAVLRQVRPMFERYGMEVLQAGGASGSSSAVTAPEPGGVLAVPLLTGDVDLTAIGTITEVLDGRVFGFGHPFNNEGRIALPMGAGEIDGVIPNLQTSFKLGAMTGQTGLLTTDESVGVAGRIGRAAPTVPIEFHVRYADGSAPRTYRFRSVVHPKFTPMIAGVALASALTGPSDPPQYNTLDYDLKMRFADGQTLDIADTAVNATAQDLLGEIGLPLTAASENPFESVDVREITGTLTVSSHVRQAQILDVNVPRSRFRPGETVRAFVTYKPFRESEGLLPVEIELPRDLPQGQYQLIISDAQRYFQDEQQAEPFRFTAENVNDIFGVLRDVAKIRQNAVYLRLLRQADGVAVGRTALPQLPSSRRQILLGAGRSNITPFVSSTLRVIPTDMVMNGSAEFAITIDPQAHVEVAAPRAATPGPRGESGRS